MGLVRRGNRLHYVPDPPPDPAKGRVVFKKLENARRVQRFKNMEKGGKWEVREVPGGYALWNITFEGWLK